MQFIKLMLPAAVLLALGGCATRDYVEQYVDQNIARVESRQANTEDQVTELTGTSQQALERATDAGVLAQGKFLYSVVLTDDGVTFGLNDSELTPEGQQRLAALAERLKSDNQNVYVEIQGHTDATGAADYNERLGLQRAEAVRRYLHRQGMALNRMATISYGEEVPLASNDTRDGRATNRRVAIVVLN